MIDYVVSIINDYDEEMTFRFRDLHDALTLYGCAKHDVSVSYISVVSVEYNQDDRETFIDGQTIRVYERE